MLTTPRDRFLLTTLTGSIMMVAALATDAMLPAFPTMAEHFGIGDAAVQQVLALFMFGYALPHLLLGSLADRLGRRPVLLAGLGIYGLGGALCLFAPNFGWLLVGRFVQGMGAAAGPILARAILRDLFHGAELGRYLSFAMVVFTAGPVFGPSIGTLILTIASWREIFIFLALTGAALIFWVARGLPETLATADPQALDPREVVSNAWIVLRHPQSGPMVLLLSLVYGSLVAYLGSSPGIFIGFFGLSEFAFALIFAVIAGLSFFAQAINAALLKRFPPARILGVVLSFHLGVTLLMLWQSYAGWASVLSLTINLAAFFVCLSFILANATALAIDPHRARAGVASGLLGFLQILIGTLLGSLIGSFVARGPTPLALGMSLIAAAVLIVFFVTRRQFSLSAAATVKG